MGVYVLGGGGDKDSVNYFRFSILSFLLSTYPIFCTLYKFCRCSVRSATVVDTSVLSSPRLLWRQIYGDVTGSK